jgi:hypothetical protein
MLADAARFEASNWREHGGVGAELDRLTRKPGLRTMLRMMRRPKAQILDLAHCSSSWKRADTFATMGKQPNAVSLAFLEQLTQRSRRCQVGCLTGLFLTCSGRNHQ